MFFYKNQSNLILVLSCLMILNESMSLSYAKEDTIDLGETGFTSIFQFNKSDEDYLKQNISRNIPQDINVKPLKLFYKSTLSKHQGPAVIRHVSFIKNNSLPQGAKIFVFSCDDEESIKAASVVNFDYGLCIEYDSPDDIRDFKKSLKLRQPLVTANDAAIKAFGLTSYPALITVHDGELEIQEGF